MNLGRMCMKLFLRGRPYTDYEDDVILHYMNGAAVGELNHSRKFRPFLCTVITQRVKKSSYAHFSYKLATYLQ